LYIYYYHKIYEINGKYIWQIGLSSAANIHFAFYFPCFNSTSYVTKLMVQNEIDNHTGYQFQMFGYEGLFWTNIFAQF